MFFRANAGEEVAVDDADGLGVDSEPLRQFAEEVRQYYGELADRMAHREIEMPDDRVFM